MKPAQRKKINIKSKSNVIPKPALQQVRDLRETRTKNGCVKAHATLAPAIGKFQTPHACIIKSTLHFLVFSKSDQGFLNPADRFLFSNEQSNIKYAWTKFSANQHDSEWKHQFARFDIFFFG